MKTYYAVIIWIFYLTLNQFFSVYKANSVKLMFNRHGYLLELRQAGGCINDFIFASIASIEMISELLLARGTI